MIRSQRPGWWATTNIKDQTPSKTCCGIEWNPTHTHEHFVIVFVDRPTDEQPDPLIGWWLRGWDADRSISGRHKRSRVERSWLLAGRPLALEGAALSLPHTEISYVVPPTPVTFLTLLWRLGLRATPWALGWQSICPFIFMASLVGKRRTETINLILNGRDSIQKQRVRIASRLFLKGT